MPTTSATRGRSADWSIQEVARLAGTTSRTLRHYDAVGLLPPTRVAANGYRHYDADALVRLQRILLLRDLGLGLPAIREALDGTPDGPGDGTASGTAGRAAQVRALRGHLEWLRAERQRLARQIASVERTITTMEGGGELMADDMFDGFDHTQYKDEVEDRWGKDAYARGDAWWREMSDDDRTAWLARTRELGEDWAAAAARGVDPESEEAQALARRHVEWLGGIPGTPGAGAAPVKEYVVGLGEMYVADERFAKSYGGVEGATFVRDALRVYADAHL
ncbi:MerR family transcriptional regulator [Cellulosimicrobium sp. BIT-GX5]|uniref:MerR family transcriptional regulator n=1 Tax=Cellulosimicrobium composti TaxID=2672572 RepID=A0A6N7ZGF8_9MICO|nr:MerR family transcriptional regulator [Cellulosimicrobium composti]MTG88545.1 MerR family transcriptional regulator [Cellulosimicrobium composti]